MKNLIPAIVLSSVGGAILATCGIVVTQNPFKFLAIALWAYSIPFFIRW